MGNGQHLVINRQHLVVNRQQLTVNQRQLVVNRRRLVLSDGGWPVTAGPGRVRFLAKKGVCINKERPDTVFNDRAKILCVRARAI